MTDVGFVEYTEKLPEPSPMAARANAESQALLTILTEIAGTKVALRYIEYVENNLTDMDGLERVALIRGEDQRRTAVENRRIALNGWRRFSPMLRRAIRR